ncbi:hypothetical protein TSUD_374730 [Trifolium subterraneum]|uniref:Uncharacterized protein n=1 Tax=Trifolium subterraneum TaxID=3900 RepID=A0A2Z6PLP0_TRISU|nr:hypothetical protein TSUD_374730 [Trifolium subterraneum]
MDCDGCVMSRVFLFGFYMDGEADHYYLLSIVPSDMVRSVLLIGAGRNEIFVDMAKHIARSWTK